MKKRGFGIVLCALGVGILMGLIMQGWGILMALIFFLAGMLLMKSKC